jgi:hypothetical protein
MRNIFRKSYKIFRIPSLDEIYVSYQDSNENAKGKEPGLTGHTKRS